MGVQTLDIADRRARTSWTIGLRWRSDLGVWGTGAFEEKLAFVRLAEGGEIGITELCRRFGIGRSCGYKWLARWQAQGEAGLSERSRRPHLSPRASSPEVEAAVLALRRSHPVWGGRKIAAVLAREGKAQLAASTVTSILRRAGVPLQHDRGRGAAWQRFEAAAPNALWQMDFKGHVPLSVARGRLYPFTVLDDHSRYSIALEACGDQREETVKARLVKAFRRHGLPHRILCDNGSPWGTAGQGPLSALTVWLIERDIAISHSRPLHPQTLGKDERFHRTLKAEALAGPHFPDLVHAQAHLDAWRSTYNLRRPHEALKGAVPAERYTPSPRSYCEDPAPFEPAPDDLLRKVCPHGRIKLKGETCAVSRALIGKTVALRPGQADGEYSVFFRHHYLKTIDLSEREA
jgi:transposase InsO family protein